MRRDDVDDGALVALAELADDNRRLTSILRATHAVCESHGDVASTSFIEVWIDEDGLTRRMRYQQTMPDRSTMDLTQEYYDFGVEVEVSAPPDDEVFDVTDLMSGG